MARLVKLPTWEQLMKEVDSRDKNLRIGQFVWNEYGQTGIDGNTLNRLFYAPDSTAIQILREYYGI